MSPNTLMLKNSGFLTLRMLLMLAVAFYTTRILLRELGVEDYGLYNVVGGLVAAFSSLRGLFASATQRFLNSEMGKNKVVELRKIFNMSLIIHIIICLIFITIAEGVGVWFLNNVLNIDPKNLTAANWVFQFSILAAVVTIMTIPFDAVIIAHQRMKVFAYISIIDGILKLAIVFLITQIQDNKLIFYSILVFLVSLIVRFTSSIYCRKNFKECKIEFSWDTILFKNMGSFAGWNFLGNSAYILSNEGINIILNIFGGTTANASRAIAYQVRAATMRFISNIFVAVNPRVVMLAAQEKKEEFLKLIFTSSKISFFLLFSLTLPVLIFPVQLLEIWLDVIPEHTIAFVQLIMLFLLVRIFHSPLDLMFKATGQIKEYQIMDSIILLLNFPISYILLSQGFALYWPFLIMIIIELLNLVCILFLAKKKMDFEILHYIKKVIIPSICVVLTCAPLIYLINQRVTGDNFIFLVICCPFLVIFASFIVGTTKSEKVFLIKKIQSVKA